MRSAGDCSFRSLPAFSAIEGDRHLIATGRYGALSPNSHIRPEADFCPDYPEDRFTLGSAIQTCIKVTPRAVIGQRQSRWPTEGCTVEPAVQSNMRA